MTAGVRNALMGAAIMLVGASASGAFAQSDASVHVGGPGTVAVMGFGSVEREAEKINVTAEARGRAPDAAAALKAAGEQRDKLLSLADGVKAAESVSKTQTGVDVSPVLPVGCMPDTPYSPGGNHTGRCTPEGYDATIRLSFAVRPAKAAGALAALLIESGANNVSIDSNDLDDHPDLERAALAAAFADARAQAEQLAIAGGAHLGRVISVVHSVNSGPPETIQPRPPVNYSDTRVVVLLKPRTLTPQTALDLQPPKARAMTSVIVTFEWLK
jgi:uncharacterized protein